MKLFEHKKDAVAEGGFAKIVRVCGGWMAFETLCEYQTWRNQK